MMIRHPVTWALLVLGKRLVDCDRIFSIGSVIVLCNTNNLFSFWNVMWWIFLRLGFLPIVVVGIVRYVLVAEYSVDYSSLPIFFDELNP